ncbi:cytochrome P450 [Gautieria morchelliformis]|nr:cytochrome P450 [Gautieria morchelliformis]KAF8509043.1 cytochrome P450 [Gautieria morchelliformis]
MAPFHSFALGSPCILVLLLVLTWIVATSIRMYFLRLRMPPGPAGLPIVGNTFEMPTELPWIRFAELGKKYGTWMHSESVWLADQTLISTGPVISFMAAGCPVVVLNDHKSSYELLDRRSTLYSHRPRFIMAGELLCNGIMLSFIPYGELFRRMRRASHDTFGPHASEKFQSLQQQEAVRLVSELLQDPEAWEEILKRSTSSNILTATYGWPRITEEHASLVKRIHAHTARLANACIPGTSMVDLFPLMNYLPAWTAKWKRDALEWHERESKMFEDFYSDVSSKMVDGVARNSFVSSLVESRARHQLSLKEAAWLAGIMFSAGAETTTASVASFLIAMIHYPQVMQKAQAQIDKIVGRDRVPTFADRPHLPYIRALVKELLRWRPAGPMGIPRRAAQDDWYEGYFIPKGTTVISNIWYGDKDPSIYPDAEEFRPERFLDETETTDISPPDMHSLGHSSFGFGRRTCVGVAFASQSLFIDFANLLWAFNIGKACDSQGNEITPSLTDVVDAGVVVAPASFRCKLTPRYSDVASVLASTVATF